MADRKITNKALAQIMNMNPVSISKLKNSDEMPAIGGETLAKLCDALNCTPADLIQYISAEENKYNREKDEL